MRFGRPGTPAAVGEKGDVSMHSLLPNIPRLWALMSPELLELSPEEMKAVRVYETGIETAWTWELRAGP